MTDSQAGSFAERQVLDVFGRTNRDGQFLYGTHEAIAGVVFVAISLARNKQLDIQRLPESLDRLLMLYLQHSGINTADPNALMDALEAQLLKDLSKGFIQELNEAVREIQLHGSDDAAEALAKAAKNIGAATAPGAGTSPLGARPAAGGVNVSGQRAPKPKN